MLGENKFTFVNTVRMKYCPLNYFRNSRIFGKIGAVVHKYRKISSEEIVTRRNIGYTEDE